MLNESDTKMIEDAFSGHTLVKNSESKSWLIQNPDKQSYWFRVTWSPGVLVVSGDVGEIILTHYQAMTTWQDAVQWVEGACHGYLMQKSNKARNFDEEETIKEILRIADEYLNEFDDDSYWTKLSNLTSIDIEGKDEIRDEIKLGYFESPQDVYEFMGGDGGTGSYSYDIETHFLYKALQIWAKTISKGIKS